ncbi:EGF-like domain-containing protein [Caenorhabditis elegans]|uniref:EGF-like domain-containing protein n=1 Tax=Caenorhabditis elegans TaxID=6239 RepID=Q8MQF7_CAEEL|nr:EGF-like domain-containing protein [Caenorhabditis elegans]CCD62332.1 EGF-like domain-containing protein [Caenorhabditis elegans]|eukprot:NP_741429.1 Uncharacterized protein CELE_C01B10.6 [Caenorhabditis elegans]
MKLLTAVLLLLVAVSSKAQGSSSTVIPSTVPSPTGDTSQVTGASSDSTGSTGSSAAPGSTVTDGSNTGSTAPVPSTTPTPMKFSTFPVSNDVSVLDAKLILQQAVQLDQQINELNTFLINAQADTNPNNSPLFAQLTAFSNNITSQNATLQGYITKLNALTATQASINTRLDSATNTFVCFSQSSCVTDVPTTPEPTSPGSTPAVTECTNTTLTATLDTPQTHPQPSTQNAAQCVVSVKAYTSTNNVNITISASFTGNDAFVKLVETRTQESVTINGTVSNYTFSGFQQVDVYYYSGPRSTVQFNFDYVEVNNCKLNCTGDNGKCIVSQSGQQYCECKKCEFSGTNCETTLPDPCQSKQKRACGQNALSPYGVCYKNICSDQCFSCACSPGAKSPPDQSCPKPSPTDPTPVPPVAPTPPSVCPTTVAPTTTPALLTSTIAPTADVTSATNAAGSTGATGSSATGSTVTSDVASSSATGGSSTNATDTTQSSTDASTVSTSSTS